MSNPIVSFSNSLASNPNLNYRDFKREVNDIASTLYVIHRPNGLLSTGITYSDAEWATLNPVPEGQPPVERSIPAMPQIHANNATSAVVSIYNMERIAYQDFIAASTHLKSAILLAVGPTISRELSHPVSGHSNVTVQIIMQHLSVHYGTLTESDLVKMNDGLKVPFSSDNTFHAESSVMSTAFSQFDSIGQPKSETDKMSYLVDATRALIGTSGAILDYKKSIPDIRNRTYANMVSYVIVHAPNFITTGATGYVGAVSKTTDIGQLIKEGIAEALRAQAQELPPKVEKDRRPRGGHNVKNYCYAHGFGHKGSVCRLMASDPNYSPAMKSATSPTSVPGGHT
jgi:hypothetical protein